MRRIASVFHSPGKKLVPFITAGFPSKEDTIPLVLAAEEAGAHVVELGIPFSDPLADGPIIQQTSQIALSNGVTIDWILDVVSALRDHSKIPIVLMGYLNPLLKMGLDRFLHRALDAGVDGLIIPDFPPDEGALFFQQARELGLSTIYLVAPNTPDTRIKLLSDESGDLLYAVSILGVTGSTLSAQKNFRKYLKRVKAASSTPIMAGFGISTPEDVRSATSIADGVVVGSALLSRLKTAADPVHETSSFIKTLVEAL
ncbi:tryptophan synthase subunit alpha [Candidatus Neomarinimicrobiota bacterium]